MNSPLTDHEGRLISKNLPTKRYDPWVFPPLPPPKPKTWRDHLRDKLITKSDQLVGRTIVKLVNDGENFTLLLDDGRVAQLQAETNWSDGADVVFSDRVIRDHAYVELGLITREILDAELEEEALRSREKRWARDRAQYEQLRRIFSDERSDDPTYPD